MFARWCKRGISLFIQYISLSHTQLSPVLLPKLMAAILRHQGNDGLVYAIYIIPHCLEWYKLVLVYLLQQWFNINLHCHKFFYCSY